MKAVFLSQAEAPEHWLPRLRALAPDIEILLPETPHDPDTVAAALVARPPPGALGRYRRLALVQSLWMGVDGLLDDPGLPAGVPLARMIDPGMVAAMSETVLACVLDWHRHRHIYRARQAKRDWTREVQRLAADRTIGILGLGELGGDAARRLAALGFRVSGWSRQPKSLAGIDCQDGPDGLAAMLAASDIVVCLLPLTPQTRGLIDAKFIAAMKPGAALVNLARGAHVVDADLLAALDAGRLSHAWLDVFETEPLPQASPYWAHPAVTVTPHCAALTEPRTAAPAVAENLRRLAHGMPLLGLVDRGAGY